VTIESALQQLRHLGRIAAGAKLIGRHGHPFAGPPRGQHPASHRALRRDPAGKGIGKLSTNS
jgi:hypothetical protein